MTSPDASDSSESTSITLRTYHPVTVSGKYFHSELTAVLNLFDLISKSVSGMDKVIKHLESTAEGSEESAQQEGDETQFGPYSQRLRDYSQHFLQMIICRLVDNFASYLADVIREVIKVKPELLRSNEQVKVEYVLQFNSMSELITDLVDRKVTALSYGGFVEMERWCNEKLKVPIVTDDAERDALIELIETRNVFVHNRGRIGEKYIRSVKQTTFVKGDERLIDLDYFVHAITILGGAALPLDERVAAKYSLTTA